MSVTCSPVEPGTFVVSGGINTRPKVAFYSNSGNATTLIPVSYTHLDVYKRQWLLIALFLSVSMLGNKVELLTLVDIGIWILMF